MSRWTVEAAKTWYAARAWPFGCNFIPSTAVNQLEMWQAETFDPATIDRELGFAAGVGMNAVRIFLHDLLWRDDPDGLLDRIETVLGLADKHGIATMPVFFDSCWNPAPVSGPQPLPRPGVHNSAWVQSPGMAALEDPSSRPRLEAYVRGVVGRFANDRRVLAWDIWNEPDNGPEVAQRDAATLAAKAALVKPLLADAFDWARAAGPSQPLTSAIWSGDWSKLDRMTPIQQLQVTSSDVVSFHNYDKAEEFARRVAYLEAFERPILCTEYLARPRGSTFQAILPVAKAAGVGAFNWGLVRGDTQTNLPWDSWDSPYVDRPAGAWFHDIFNADGTPFDPAEPIFLRAEAQSSV
ncbi:glycoside hydrolase family 5 protein [Polymorphobacter sp. PAMC 29334]|uniref:cellulase family glycosylhydrolase n=1 Tax=Polymorphobacter sp. PAMC 29334 TaxID=2862331 RepID=UPI001C678DDF|nr:cellulase family glycosylhydrolase [Polymorphobacter sp. PAMC 29334]QYE36205.1 glycoside hydrolase family 5 protein [Polymorphobacter sp. PAMC 29334]